jgi:hypothetical protein
LRCMMFLNCECPAMASVSCLFVIASQRARPEVAGPMTGSAKQSRADEQDCFVALLLAMTT